MIPNLVRDFMTTSVTTLTDDAKLLDAILLLRRTGKRHLPILTAEEKIVGILSDRDLRLLNSLSIGPCQHGGAEQDLQPDSDHGCYDEEPDLCAAGFDPRLCYWLNAGEADTVRAGGGQRQALRNLHRDRRHECSAKAAGGA